MKTAGYSKLVGNKVVAEKCKLILRFRKEDENVSMSPIVVMRELRKKLGEVEMAKVLREGVC